ncbi:MAG: penicillin-binding protein activator [Cellvibrionales bacterium]|nr:penicillin-binding protein activator [Cellvibrionales bacterium]
MNKPFILPLLWLFIFFLVSCSTTDQRSENTASIMPSSSNSSAFSRHLKRTVKLIDNNNFVKASESIANLSQIAATHNEQAEVILTQVLLLDKQGQTELARTTLINEQNRQKLNQGDPSTKKQANELLARLNQSTGHYLAATKGRIQNTQYYQSNTAAYQKNHQAIWQSARRVPVDQLKKAKKEAANPTVEGWLSLAEIFSTQNDGFKNQIKAVDHWNQLHPTHPAALIPPSEITELRTSFNDIPKHIAVILPFEGKYKPVSDAIRDGMMHSYFNQKLSQLKFYSADPNTSFMETYQTAVHNGADLVIGPLLKEHLKELSRQDSLPVKTIALNTLKDFNTHTKNLYQFGLGSEDEVDSLIHFSQKGQHKRAIVLSENSEWGRTNLDYFKKEWEKLGNTIVDSATFTSTQSQAQVIQKLLNIDDSHKRKKQLEQTAGLSVESEPRRRQDIDMVVIFAKPDQALAIPPLFNFYYAQDLPIYSTSSVYRGYTDNKVNQDLNGVRLTEFPMLVQQKSIPSKYKHSSLVRMFAFGQDAFSLAERSPSIQTSSNLRINGATGTLYLKDQVIHRELTPAIFKNGYLKPYRIADNSYL